jgi:hypothetical protein
MSDPLAGLAKALEAVETLMHLVVNGLKEHERRLNALEARITAMDAKAARTVGWNGG